MKQRYDLCALGRWLVVFAPVICFALYGSPSLAVSSAASTADFAAIDRFIDSKIQADRVPGVSLAIVHDNAIVYAKGYGVAGPDRTPITPQTSFILGSMSKSFTAMAIMQLVEQGKIALDAPVQRYISWFQVADPQASRELTLRQLLYHTSGIPTNAPRATGPTPSLADHVRTLRHTQLDHAPGTIHDYASPNYQVLGLVVELVSGQPFGEYVQENIFTPLGMNHSFISQDLAQKDGMASGYQYWFGFPAATTLPYGATRLPTAALISSAEDLGHYVIAQLNQGRYGDVAVLTPQSLAATHQPGAPSDEFSYAMGWRVGPINGIPAIHHGGIVANFRGKIVMLPEQKWGVIVLTNISSFVGSPTSHAIADGVATMLAGKTPPRSTLNLSLIYLGLSIGLGLITLSQITGLFRLGHWRARMAEQLANKPNPMRQIGVPLLVELLIPLAIIGLLPRLIGVPLEQLVQQVPDLSAWLICTIVLALLAVLIKCIMVVATFRQNRQHQRPT